MTQASEADKPGKGATAASSVAQSDHDRVTHWLAAFEQALADGNAGAVAMLFAPDGHWRDVLAFTWSITPAEGADAIGALLVDKQAATQARGFAIAPGRVAPRRAPRAGYDVIEAIFQFETALGRGFGVLRLLANDSGQAIQLLTTLHELKGFEERIGARRPTGGFRHFGGPNWKELREAAQQYKDREPTVLIVGGGQAGLGLAATLGRIGVDTLVVDRLPRVGDCWRTRYHALALHNDTDYNHLPYMPFPPSWPTYLPKDMVADWFEAYVMAMEINFWTGTELVRGSFDETAGHWNAVVRRPDGSERTLHPKHLVFANGLVGSANIPELPGMKDFKGSVLHTSQFDSGREWRGKRALVIGTGTSGHDVAQELHAHGCATTIVQRGSTMVLSIDPSAKMAYGSWHGVSVDDGDILAMVNTKPMFKRSLQGVVAKMIEADRKIIDGLVARGFKFDAGEDGAGHHWKVRQRYGGYYLEAGCSQLIIDGEVGLLQYDQIERFVADGALLKDGTVVPADLIVLATGFVAQERVVGKLLGEDMARKIGPVWGFAADGEMSNMWRRTPQDGLWFVGGSFFNARTYSRYVALQIKAIEEGLWK
jgi:putative flavoprotein involved in K+ transport